MIGSAATFFLTLARQAALHPAATFRHSANDIILLNLIEAQRRRRGCAVKFGSDDHSPSQH